MPEPVLIQPQSELAKLLTPEYRDAILKVRDTIASVPALRNEEWSSLTRHVTELYVLEKFGYLRCSSGDSVADGIVPLPGETNISFNPKDTAFLLERGIQVKGSRAPMGRFGKTGDIKLTSPFKYLYAVWVDVGYRVIETEVYRLEYPPLKEVIEQRDRENPARKNNRKLGRSDALHLDARVNPPSQLF